MTTIDGKKSRHNRLPPQLYFVGSAIFHYLGPAFAVLLFARVSAPGVAWLRIVSAGLIFAAWRRPWRAFLRGGAESRRTILGLGVLLAVMNVCFYEAIARLPLGTVAAIEFVGPVCLAVAATRTMRNSAALVLATVGVLFLTDVRLAGEPIGFAFAFVNAVLFTLYIVFAHRLSRVDDDSTSIDRLGASMLIASVAITPIGFAGAWGALFDPAILLAGIGIGITSSVIPYVLDQLAMERLPQATYALFVAILPATAVLIGIIVLRQIPILHDLVGVTLVILGVILHRESV